MGTKKNPIPGLKAATRHAERILPYKPKSIKTKTDATGIVTVEGQSYASDIDILGVIDDGRIRSNVATQETIDALNDAWLKSGKPVDPPYYPVQHAGQQQFFSAQGEKIYPKIAGERPKFAADFYLDANGRLRVDVVSNEQYLDHMRRIAYNEDLNFYPWANPDLDWNLWYESRPYFKGTEKPWTKGAISKSVYTYLDPKTKRPKQTAFYDEEGNVIAHIDWKQHGKAAPGHFHFFPEPGNPASGHGPGKPHYLPFTPEDWGFPPAWNEFP